MGTQVHPRFPGELASQNACAVRCLFVQPLALKLKLVSGKAHSLFCFVFLLLWVFLSSIACNKAVPSLASVPHHGGKGSRKREGQSLLSLAEVKHTLLCLSMSSLQGCG